MSVPFVTGNVTAADWFILLYYYIRDLGLLCVNSGLLYLSCMLIGFGFLGNKLFVSTADRLRAVLDIYNTVVSAWKTTTKTSRVAIVMATTIYIIN